MRGYSVRMIERIDQLAREAEAQLAQIGDGEALERFRVKYLGSKGALKDLMGLMKQVPAEHKKEFGQRANTLKTTLTEAFESTKTAIGGAKSRAPGHVSGQAQLDITEPALAAQLGRRHPITQTMDELAEVFGRMGFDVAHGPELEDEQHNFVALNIPASHPARDPLDNYFLHEPAAEAASSPRMLRSQTSTVQIRVMERTQPPVRVISMGRVYRPDEHDATHYSMFHQVEGLYVDQNVSLVDLNTTLLQFAHAYFGPGADVKLVPSYFPFTEPSAELYVKVNFSGRDEWMEVGGCGMVDPAVFEAVGYDPEVWTGFAFGLGIERLLMRKHHVPDIRWLFENDVRFLRRF